MSLTALLAIRLPPRYIEKWITKARAAQRQREAATHIALEAETKPGRKHSAAALRIREWKQKAELPA